MKESSLPLQAANADRTKVSSAQALSPPPPQPGSAPNPTGMRPVTCAAAAVDVPLPPRPKETQRHLALTQLKKSQEQSCLLVRAIAPKSRRGRARALTSRRDRRKWSGRSLAISFATAWVPYRPRQQRSPSSLLPLCLCNSLPWRPWPHPLLQHEVIATQSCRARPNTSGTDWLLRPPLPLPTQLTESSGSLWGKKTETAISGRGPPKKREPELPCHFSGENPCFIIWSSLFVLEIAVSLPLPRLTTAT